MADDRGAFLEFLRSDLLVEVTGRRLDAAQANCSVSRRGVVRGVHFADVPPSQAKYVTCLSGAVLDVVVDLRVGSPTFGSHDTVLLDDSDRRAVFISEGLGHAFQALTDGATVAYVCSTPYAPAREHGVDPCDPELALPWSADMPAVLSDRDAAAPSLAAAQAAGTLPTWTDCLAYYASIRRAGTA
jgi:dTDP-4-dehydrorhamnose 3,5-epimerase